MKSNLKTIEDIYEIEYDGVPHTLPIIVWPNKDLNVKSTDITRFDTEKDKHLEQLVLNMLATMVKHNGIGLSAIQVGYPANIFIVRTETNSVVFINPEIVEVSEDSLIETEEGCISVPGYFEKRKRSGKCVLKFQDMDGSHKEVELQGIWAFVAQHEMEHLQGKTFIEDVSRIKKFFIEKKVKKAVKKAKQEEKERKAKVREAKIRQKTLEQTLNIQTKPLDKE